MVIIFKDSVQSFFQKHCPWITLPKL